jgi:small subunit ribosomal protein S6
MAKPNFYETLYIVRPDLGEEDTKRVQEKLREIILAHEGEIFKFDKWAERELAYEIRHYTKGIYYIIVYKALPTVVADLETNFRLLNDEVLRFMTVKIKEDAVKKEQRVSSPESEETQIPSEGGI